MDQEMDAKERDYPPLSEQLASCSRRTSQSKPPAYSRLDITPLNINIQVVGSRGDVQPFIALGVALKQDGHRVRISTHAQFGSIVTSSGLEFFDVGGDPADLMAFMVESPSMIPSMKQIRAGIVQKKRAMFVQMLDGFWQSCTAADRESHVPFVADAIIANPPSFAHVHCAQALGLPVHLMFTMPWSSTRAFPHPLASVSTSRLDWKTANYASYAAVEMLTWQGLGDIVNDWRTRQLGLEPVPGTEGHRLLEELEVPFTYCWSPSLVPKPGDWGEHIDVCGFFFREPPTFSPPSDLAEFLNAGPPPVYIGFGSIVAGDSEGLLATILSAVRMAGVRAIVSQGWSNLEGDSSEDVYYIRDCPHEWLFQQVSVVVHHGGAGTTACGLRYGRPTAVVPFFGDQPFWGAAIARAGAGPEPIPYRSLASQSLAQAISFCLKHETAAAASKIAESLAAENGVVTAVQSFYAHLPLEKMKCDFRPEQPAGLVFGRGKGSVKMSKPIASVLIKNERLEMKQLMPYRPNPLAIENIRWDPFTAVSAAAISTLLTMIGDTADIFIKPIQAHRKTSGSKSTQGNSLDATIKERPKSDAPSFAMLPLTDTSQRGRLQEMLSRVSRNNSVPSENRPPTSVAGSVGKMVGNSTKGVLVDVPLALTEGLRAVPNLYGEPVKKHDAVSGFRSGVSVAGKTFYEGMTGSVTDIFTYTYHGKRDEGAAGAAKGLAKGAASFVVKSSSATLGLLSYPAQGIYRSIWAKAHETPVQSVVAAKVMEGDWIVSVEGKWSKDYEAILQEFNGLRSAR